MKTGYLKPFLVLTALLFTGFSIYGQCDDFDFSGQFEVDNFPSNCTEITGNLNIEDDFSMPISNIDALSNVTSIGGNLTISAQELVNLNGLENLSSIGGDLILTNTDRLYDLSGLENLSSIGGDLVITNSYFLACLKGLSGLTTIGGTLEIRNNDHLMSLIGMNNLNTIGNELKIMDNNDLRVCNASNLCTLIDQVGTVQIANNDPGCESLAAVQAACDNPSVCLENLTIRTQAQIDNFAFMFPTCTVMPGDFGISNSVSAIIFIDNITDVLGLAQITAVEGDFWLTSDPALNNQLPSFQGMHNLVHVGGNFNISITTTLGSVSLIGFEGLETIGGSLIMNGIGQFNSLEGFSSLRRIEGDLKVEDDMFMLADFSGLSALEYIGGDFDLMLANGINSLNGLSVLDSVMGGFRVEFNNFMTTLGTLPALRYIGGSMELNDNSNLVSIGSFPVLEHIGGLGLNFNHNLESLTDFPSLTTIANGISIFNNSNLQSLAGLENVETIGGSLSIFSNNQLSTCSILPICIHLSNGTGSADFSQNASGCNEVSEVSMGCDNLFSEVEGQVFIDLNCDQIQGSEDIALDNHLLIDLDNNLPFTATNVAGVYDRILLPSSTTNFTVETITGYSAVPASRSITTTATTQVFAEENFSLCPDSDFHNLQAVLTPFGPPRPGFINSYQICVENVGTNVEDGSLVFDFLDDPNATEYVTIVDANGGTIDGTSVTWSFNDLALFQPLCFNVEVELSADTPLGLLLYTRTLVTAASGITETDLADNFDNLSQEVVGSFDPNDKTVDIEEIDVMTTSEGTELTYLVRFQNTGTFPATFVELLDTISPNLDLSTFKMITASHDYVLSLPEDRVVKWRFDDINLADSTSNEPESHGFVKFSIKTMANLNLSDVVENSAAIFFDFNAPIITNTATTEVVTITNVAAIESAIPFSVYPNPTAGIVYLEYTLAQNANCQFALFNVDGKVMQEISRHSSSAGTHLLSLDLSGYPKGIYYIKFTKEEESRVKKVVVH